MRIRFEAFFLLIAILTLLGCSKSVTPVKIATNNQILLKGNAAEPADLDPHTVTGLSEYNILLALFEGLVSTHPETLAPVPGVAESWEVSDDNKTYTFHLRKDAKWSNSDPVTAKDFLFSFKRALSEDLSCEYASMFYPVQNAQAYHEGALNDFNEVGFEAPDDYTLKITLHQPIPYFLSLITHWVWYPVHEASIVQHGDISQRGSGWTQPGHLVSNGPFALKSWKLGESIIVRQNPFYWNKDQVQLKEIHFYPITESNTEERAFRAGQLHITESLPIQKYETYYNENSPYLQVSPALGTYCYTFNTTKTPFNDPKIRQAFSLALDRESLAKHVVKGGKEAAYTFTPANTPGYEISARAKESISSAQALLEEAGYPQGKNFPKVTLLYNTSENHRLIAEAIQEMWRQNLGIEVELVNEEWKVFLNSRKLKNFDIVRGNWMGDYPDPNTFLEVYTSNNPNNHSGWANEAYDELIHQANSTLDAKERLRHFQEAESLLLLDAVLIPLYFFNTVQLVHTDVHGWYPNITNVHPYQYIYLKQSS